MTEYSKIEWDNGLGFIEEESLLSVEYRASLGGAIPTMYLVIANGQRGNPQLRSGTHTASTSTTVLTDSAADFINANVTPGDLVINSTDGDAQWEVVTVDSATALTVRLFISGGVDDDFDTSDAYVIQKRNRLDIFIPKRTDIRVTGRDLNKVYFRGRVMEAVSEMDFGEELQVVVAGFDSELREGQSFHDYSGSTLARSEVVRLGPTEQHDGSDLSGGSGEGTGMFVFPHISFFEGRKGIEHSMNLQTVSPDTNQAVRSQLSEYLDMAKEDQWTPSVMRVPSVPVITQGTQNGEEELTFPSAQGNLAQGFSPASHILLSKVELNLNRVGSITGNLYVRIEANSVAGDVALLDIPSGELVTPWAESQLVNMSNVASGSETDLAFTFTQPVALSAGSTYWIVLSYQEDNVTGWVTSSARITWYDNSAGGLATGTQAKYSSGVWAAVAGVDFDFSVLEHADAWWYYDHSGDTWENQTARVLTNDASLVRFLDLIAGGGAVGDRLYVRTAGPIRGFDLQIEVAASAEYGTITAKYLGSTRAKIAGRHTAATSTTVLTDTDKDFRRTSVVVGNILHNITDGSYGVITVIAATTLTVQDLIGGVDDDFDIGDLYEVVNLELVDSGAATSGSATVMTDSGGSFVVEGVREGDIIVNTTDNTVGVITVYTATAITTATGMGWDVSDTYQILSRWRTLTLKNTSTTFQVGTGGAPVTVRLEWEIESDWLPDVLEAGFPEASSPGFTDVGDMSGFWVTIQSSVFPATTRAEIELVTPIPGHGYTVSVDPNTHADTILATGTHDGGDGSANLIDVGVDYVNDHGILVGDTVFNTTDGSSGVVTAISTSTGATTIPNDTLEMVLAGGTDDDWDDGDVFRITRSRHLLSYFRNGSRPLGGPALEGLTFRQGGPASDQVWTLRTPKFSKSYRSGVNRIRVIGRSTTPASITEVVNDLEAQRDQRQVVVKTITDYSLHTSTELIDRGNAELARLGYPARRGTIVAFQLPFHQRVARRPSWVLASVFTSSELDGAVYGAYVHSTGASAAALQDTGINFDKWDIEVGDLVTNITDGSSAVITGVSTTTNENDTVDGTLSGGTDDDWDVSDQYRIERRNYVKVGDLVRVKAEDPQFIDADYLVTSMVYTEPEFTCVLQVSRNFQAPSLGDVQTQAEMFGQLQDEARMAAQLGAS